MIYFSSSMDPIKSNERKFIGNLWGMGLHLVLFASASPQKHHTFPGIPGFSKDPERSLQI
jgi:hypothetical protein